MSTRDRYEVCSITGYSEGIGVKQSTSYWIADRDYGFREVETFYSSRRSDLRPRMRLARAQRRCAELNAENEAWERSEALPLA
jgi:hypothetical protein